MLSHWYNYDCPWKLYHEVILLFLSMYRYSTQQSRCCLTLSLHGQISRRFIVSVYRYPPTMTHELIPLISNFTPSPFSLVMSKSASFIHSFHRLNQYMETLIETVQFSQRHSSNESSFKLANIHTKTSRHYLKPLFSTTILHIFIHNSDIIDH